MRRVAVVFALASALTTGPIVAQVVPRFDLRVPMRDGVELSADAYLPERALPAPVLLVRTPYLKSMGMFDMVGMAQFYGGHGYALVVQDTRGRGDSDGSYDFWFTDAEDGYDTIEWVARQPWSNGKVCMLGVSYLGTVQWLAAKERPPALKCLIPTAPAGRYGFEELPYLGGAFRHRWALHYLHWCVSGTTPCLDPAAGGVDWDRVLAHRPLLSADSVLGRKMRLYREFLQNSTAGPYWDRIVLGRKEFGRIDLPVLHITGWFDGDQPGALHYWRGMRAHSPARERQYLIVGPWNHLQTFMGGATKIGALELTPDAVIDNRKVHLEFFDRYLKGTGRFDHPRARIYFTGSNRWREFTDYPPPNVTITPLHLHSGGRANSRRGDGVLDWSVPGDQPPDRYRYDPKNPVTSDVGFAADHSAVELRDDILVYTTPPLERPVEIAGPVFLELFAASDARDTDFTVKLLDVFPDGRAVALGPYGFGIRRARYRNGYDREELLTPGRAEKYRIELFDVGHSFQPGHRIRVEVSSSFAPDISPNQNTGNPVATDTEWRVANQTIYHDRRRPSAILLPVLR